MVKDSILSIIYPDDEIYIDQFTFHLENLSIEVRCIVPMKSYAKQSVPYVTAENHVRCLSQASYLLAHHLIAAKLIDVAMDVKTFLSAMEKWELYYRNLSMTFHERPKRGEPFIMKLSLENVKEIKRINDYILFSFTNQKTVISGEMSFVVIK